MPVSQSSFHVINLAPPNQNSQRIFQHFLGMSQRLDFDFGWSCPDCHCPWDLSCISDHLGFRVEGAQPGEYPFQTMGEPLRGVQFCETCKLFICDLLPVLGRKLERQGFDSMHAAWIQLLEVGSRIEEETLDPMRAALAKCQEDAQAVGVQVASKEFIESWIFLNCTGAGI